jgi:plasmid replication initiation protein
MELARSERQDIRELARLVGRDEMNLAEFPITLLTDRVPDGLKTLEFEAGGGKLIVSGSDAHGLPTAIDADVIVGLIQLTKVRNNFTDPTVNFTRYELLKLLGWPDRGAYYKRLDESLHRWVGVTLRYDEAWWDNDIKTRVDASFHILESVVILEQTVRRKLKARGQQHMPFSTFTWNKMFFRSCQADNLKRLDLETYLSLQSAVTKQMYRFLDKRFYTRRDWTFDVREFAFGHVGLSRNYTAAKIKEKLQPAIEELEAIGFIEKMSPEERYTKVGRGEWKITLKRVEERIAIAEPEPKPSEHAAQEEALIARGVTPAVAAELAASHSAELIRERIEMFDWLSEKKDKRVSKNPGGYLAESIRKGYVAPKGFESKAEQEQKRAAEAERRRKAEESKKRADAEQLARDQAEQKRIADYLESLTASEREALEAEALAKANPFFASQLRRAKGNPESEARYRKLIVEAHVSDILEKAH